MAYADRYGFRGKERGNCQWRARIGPIGGRIVLSMVIGYDCAVRVFIPTLFMEVIRTNSSPGGFPLTLRCGLAIQDPGSPI